MAGEPIVDTTTGSPRGRTLPDGGRLLPGYAG
jgi:hypothetical protein